MKNHVRHVQHKASTRISWGVLCCFIERMKCIWYFKQYSSAHLLRRKWSCKSIVRRPFFTRSLLAQILLSFAHNAANYGWHWHYIWICWACGWFIMQLFVHGCSEYMFSSAFCLLASINGSGNSVDILFTLDHSFIFTRSWASAWFLRWSC